MGEQQTVDSWTRSGGSDGPDGPRGLAALVEALRPAHWIKNGFVAAALLFSGRFTAGLSWALTAAAVAAFCMVSSAVYLFNDLCDRRADRLHPAKRRRPIASGRLAPPAAGVAAAVLLAAGLGTVAVAELLTAGPRHLLGGHALLVWTAAYVALQVLYSTWLKRIVFVDVLVVALGFVLRAMAGAAAIAVPVSPWLVICTLSLCLFIAVTKRRSEIAELSGEALGGARPVNRRYDARQIDLLLTVSTAMAILTYALYCLAPRTIHRIGSAHMVWTVPLVIYGLLRFNRLTAGAGPSDPVRVLVRDRVMWLVLATYGLLCALIVKLGAHPAVRDILDVGGK